MSSHRNVHTYLNILRRDLSRFSAESAKLRLIPTKSEYSGTIRGEDIALTAGGKLTIVEEVKIGARSARMKVSRTSYKYKYVDGAGNTVFRYECNPYGRNDWVDHPLHHLHVGNVETRYMTQPPRLAWVVRFVHECKPTTPAMAAGKADHAWTIDEFVGLLDVRLAAAAPPKPRVPWARKDGPATSEKL